MQRMPAAHDERRGKAAGEKPCLRRNQSRDQKGKRQHVQEAQRRVACRQAVEEALAEGNEERVERLYATGLLQDYPEAAWVQTENVPIYAVEHMEQHRVFTSILTLTFRVVR